MAGHDKGTTGSDVDSTARFYTALADMASPQDPRQTGRRRVMALLQDILTLVRASNKETAFDTGLHASVVLILVLTFRMNPEHVIKVRELQRALGFTAGGVTRRLDAMIRDGLIVREPDPSDGRALLARLTPKGVAVAQQQLARSDERSKRLEQGFTVKEWETLCILLERFKSMLD